MSWSSEQVVLLIEQFKEHPCLYAVKHPEYHNRTSRNAAIKKIVKRLRQIRSCTTELEVRKKWNGLRNTYVNEKKKIANSLNSRADEETIYKPSLWYFENMTFLNASLSMRRSNNNVLVCMENAINDKEESEASIKIEDELIKEEMESAEVENISEKNLTELSETSMTDSLNDNYSDGEHGPGIHKKQRKRRKQQSDVDDILTCLQAISNAASKLGGSSNDGNKDENEDILFGRYVGTSIHNIKNKKIKLKLQHTIQNAIFNAKMEELVSDV